MKRAFVVWRRIECRFSETSFKRPKLERIMKRHLIPTLAAAVLGLLASSGFAPAQAYTITDLGANTMPYAVNDGGQVAGAVGYPAVRVNRTTTIPGYSRGFIWNNGATTQFGTLGGPGSTARAINIYGQVAGFSDTSSTSGSARAFLWESATGMRNLNLIAGPNGITAASLGWTLTSAWGINDNGQIVGCGQKSGQTSSTDAYLWERDAAENVSVQRVNLGIPQRGDAETRGINNAGQVAGSVPNVVSGQTWPYASLWQRDLNGVGYNVPLGLLGGIMSQAYGINKFAEVAGYATRANGYVNAFYWSDANNGVSDPGKMVSLGTLGGMMSVAFTINDAGQVVGWAFDAAGAYRAFVWDAVNGMRDLNALSNVGSTWLLKAAVAINNPGWIVGHGSFTVISVGRGNKVTYSTQNHGFLLTP
jgi:probable HAF family extracellular repeat protein